MNIRRYRTFDAPALSEIFVSSVRALGPAFYSAEQVDAWASISPTADQIHIRCTDGRTMLIAVNDADHPLAFGDIEGDGHIDVLYCSPEMAGKGIMSALYDALEDIAIKRKLNRLFVEASEAAKPLFEKKGFQVRARRELSIGNVAIHNYAMEKML